MFTEDTSTFIQYLTYPLALLGFILVALEIFKKDFSLKLEEKLRTYVEELQNRVKASFAETISQGKTYLSEFEQHVKNPPRNPIEGISGSTRSVGRILGYLSIYLNWALCGFLLLLVFAFKGCNRITGGNALAGVGVVIEVICFSGDTYQFLTGLVA